MIRRQPAASHTNVLLYCVAVVVMGLTIFGGIIAVLTNLYILRLGYDSRFVGLCSAGSLFAMAASCLPAGALGRRYGSLPLMITGLSTSLLAFVAFSLSYWVPVALQPAWLFGMNSLNGVTTSLYIVNSAPFAMMIVRPEEVNRIFSLQTAIFAVASFAGSTLGGVLPALLAAAFDIEASAAPAYGWALLIGSLLFIPAIVALCFVRTEEVTVLPAPEGKADRPPYALVTLIGIIMFLVVAGEGPTRTFFTVYLDAELHVPTWLIGIISGIGLLLSAGAAFLSSKGIRRWGVRHSYMWATIGVAASIVPLALIAQPAAAAVGYCGVMMFGASGRPASMIFQMESVKPEWRSLMSGASTMALGISWGIMAVGGGYAIESIGYRGVFLFGAALTFSGALLFWALFVRGKRAVVIEVPSP